MPIDAKDLQAFTAKVVSSYVGNNVVSVADIPALIHAVQGAFQRLGDDSTPVARDEPVPAAPIKKSVTPEFIICLEDGKKLKMLKRHLKTVYNLSPDEYRAKWGLPADYPMVAPNYAKARSEMATRLGLGRKRV
ncbi:MAG TPA: MucR family transcriptional regulator [Azospirillaceae bacterium]|nr:MucR family transcriptional regulator [Azospirillaceae bacterium]HRQ80522.1 MucR family transcriptional regulator [Azospirillaceae bacterium]